MRWVRSVPDPKPDRPHVIDRIEILPVHQRMEQPGNVMRSPYGEALASLNGPVVLIEWDLAVDPDLRARFEARAAERPDWPLVAPYQLWVQVGDGTRPQWAHRRADESWIQEGDPECVWFSFGLIYLPARFLDEARAAGLASWDYPGTDQAASNWARLNGWTPIPIAWDCRPIHVHW